MYEIIVNPASKSGKGLKIWLQVEQVLREREIPFHVQLSRKVGDITKFSAALVAGISGDADSAPQKLIILGGDGTMNEVLQGIASVPDGFERVQIGYLPTGSSNDFARDFHFPSDTLSLLDQILNCERPHLADIGCLTYANTADFSRIYTPDLTQIKRYFDVSAGIGFDAAVCEEALSSSSKNLLNKLGLGKLTYLVIALRQLIKARKISCDLTIDENTKIHLDKFLFVAGMIHQYEGGGFMFCPGASDTDGLLDICVAGNISKLLILLALPTAFVGKHYMFHGIDKYLATTIRIQTSAPLWVHTDGEVHIKSSDITMTCESKKLQLLISHDL